MPEDIFTDQSPFLQMFMEMFRFDELPSCLLLLGLFGESTNLPDTGAVFGNVNYIKRRIKRTVCSAIGLICDPSSCAEASRVFKRKLCSRKFEITEARFPKEWGLNHKLHIS
jgi:hypothetical protein